MPPHLGNKAAKSFHTHLWRAARKDENFSSFRAALHKRLWKLLSALFPECGGHTALMAVYI
jgi:hypothetical protein